MKMDDRDSAECQNWEKKDIMVIIEIVVNENNAKNCIVLSSPIKMTKKMGRTKGLNGEQQIFHFCFRERATWARSGQYLHGWAGSLQMVSEPIPDPDVGVCSVWPRNPMGHNEDVFFYVKAPPPGPLRRGVVPLTGYPPSSQGFLSPPWARTWDHELRYPFVVVPTTNWATSSVGSGNYHEWVSKLMVPGSSPRRRKKPL